MNLQNIQNIFDKKLFHFSNIYLDETIQNFNFFLIPVDYQYILESFQNNNKYNIIVIDEYIHPQNKCDTNDFFIICFDYNLLLIPSSDISLIFTILSSKKESIIYCISKKAKEKIDEAEKSFKPNMHFRFSEENDRSSIEKLAEPFFIKFRLNFDGINPEITAIIEYLWEIIRKSVSVFLIKIGYLNARYDRNVHFDEYLFSGIKDDDISSEKYIDLMLYNNGSSSSLYLVYLIQKEMICLMKTFSKTEEEKKLFEREHNNYLNIKHPLLPRYFGTAHYLSCNCLIIEYLEGKMLCEIDFSRKSLKATMKIIFEMMIIVAYLHCNGYIYRDLKPNNIIVDKNNTIYLIDFDRMIKSSLNSNPNITENFMTEYLAPEILNRKPFTYKADIYSLWKIISNIILKSNHKELSKIYEMFFECASSNEDDRPSISKLIDQFYIQFFSIVFNINEIKTKINYESDIYTFYLFLVAEYQDADTQKYLLTIYKNGCIIWKDVHNNIIFSYNYGQIYIKYQKNIQYLVPNMKKAIGYCMLVADQNNSIAQYNLGVTYEKGEYVKKDMNKAIYYYTLSANLNNQRAQYNLGSIYYYGKYVKKDINKAIYYFTLAANQNNPNAQFALGLIYFFGKYATKDINKAIYYFTLAANQNNSDAQFILGSIYEDNQYVTKDINKAIYYLTLASNQNNPNAQCNLGAIYFNGQYIMKDINKAFHYFTLSANQNNAIAQFNLGYIYFNGKDVTKDINKAIHYFELAAHQNHLRAQFDLGVIYYEGKYVMKDINKAIYYFTLAANQNHAGAQFNLGLIYDNNQYVINDINKAIHYYKLSADQNDPNAQFNLGLIYYEGQNVAKDINKAFHYFELAAKQNHSYALFYLGFIYYKGKYVTKDINKAIHYFTLAANQNNSNAQFILGIIYEDNQYVTKDINKAIRYYTLAANQNHSNAQFNLGLIYRNGQDVAKDINKAIHYYTLAANQNNSKAQFGLGAIYYEGLHVAQNIDKAIHYFMLAANQNHSKAKFNLGVIYYKGQYVARDMNKAIHYFTLASSQNNSNAQYSLGFIYDKGEYVAKDINKSIHYYTLAANKNHSVAQFDLGLKYFGGQSVARDIKKGIYLITLSSINGFTPANFFVGCMYHAGKYAKRDIDKAIHYYKEASSFNIKQAKNNLGILYKNGFNEIVTKNLGLSIDYFKEAIHQKNDILSMYNLAHLYLYEDPIKNSIDESIKLLIRSVNEGAFQPSMQLLCLALLKRYGFYLDIIKEEVEERSGSNKELAFKVCKKISDMQLYDEKCFESQYEYYRNIDFLYNHKLKPILSKSINDIEYIGNSIQISKIPKISKMFYEGFSFDIDRNKEFCKLK